ncbi:di-trans,poly-cis-decaprenylcistransferase [Candidatus Nomurabacteria bacterium]|uniref:Isoprenyl transferase n=1 Tax=candidate division WWE3 bacterium TaxID=2053526 RepID=A0A955IWC4_UNCKA|nr:di-trans,poly-cis-decaprenylcistransferase [candidate division WWE3 bacterium]MCB9823443.1 di-trans,poly-cis-decaprenylcistransferase [Candidatus Nomurabacteria bacterium]MCB9827725.1 di-trans,poly-cis-decaprenylcistransferase [Candidatus Nomurabacteria bacterium]HXK52991.1 polyprenyl diphosphate synthase [bacterium]
MSQYRDIPVEKMPNHIAILPNGNRTWARQRGLSPMEGHNKGVEVIASLARELRVIGVHTASVWGLSTENFANRDKNEVENLIRLLSYSLDKWGNEAHKDGARLIHLGRRDRLPKKVIDLIDKWQEKTLNNTKHTLNIAFDYGGHDELLRAMKKAFDDVTEGKISFSDLEKTDGMYHDKYPYRFFKRYLDTGDQPYPYPDLIIRGAGELRLSGWMPWQSVYSELYTENVLLPDFDEELIYRALKAYSTRDRKYGGSSDSA